MSTSTVWDARRERRLRALYPTARGTSGVRAIADALGVSEQAVTSKAKRLGLTRGWPAAKIDDDQRARLRELVEAHGEQAGIEMAASEMRQSVAAVSAAWRKMGRARTARVGSWTEGELDEAVRAAGAGCDDDTIARRLGRQPGDVRLKLLMLGCRPRPERTMTLDQASVLLGVSVDEMVLLVDEGRLSARPCDGTQIPHPGWVTSDQRVAALICADPAVWNAAGCPDPAAVAALCFEAGARAATRAM